MIVVLWRRFIEGVRSNHHRITLWYLCISVTIIMFLLLTASPVEVCK